MRQLARNHARKSDKNKLSGSGFKSRCCHLIHHSKIVFKITELCGFKRAFSSLLTL